MEQKTTKHVTPGSIDQLGATVSGRGVNFAVYSKFARQMFLLFFNRDMDQPTDVIEMFPSDENIWHVFVKEIKPGQLYGLKAAGPYNPFEGHRFNEYKLLVDPYAKAVSDPIHNIDGLLYGYDIHASQKDLVMDKRENMHVMTKCVVVDDGFNWGDDRPPRIPWEETILYETHVKGFTADPSSRVHEPGTYMGLIEKIPYLKSLGITAVELLPVFLRYSRDYLEDHGLSEYWGYNTIGFFAPEITFGSQSFPGSEVQEFKEMVKALHASGLEVILDVV
ncbi:MAG: glycogen debranching enzyme GlgX, partial [Candidatus Omnitrophica bacterium]|nr:glycogen debranching enzyme GlgX [Candidatus Omnitrophota bacterium]